MQGNGFTEEMKTLLAKESTNAAQKYQTDFQKRAEHILGAFQDAYNQYIWTSVILADMHLDKSEKMTDNFVLAGSGDDNIYSIWYDHDLSVGHILFANNIGSY